MDVPRDAASDAGIDAPIELDVPADARTDVPMDVPTDVPTDVPIDVPPDAPVEDTSCVMRANCDGTPGCEVMLGTTTNCQACMDRCTAPADPTAMCDFATGCGWTCNMGFANCDTVDGNGCEATPTPASRTAARAALPAGPRCLKRERRAPGVIASSAATRASPTATAT